MSDLSKEESIQFAAHFEMLKLALRLPDWEYGEKLVKALREQANFQETAIVFNPGYPLIKNDIIRLQAEALSKFCEGVRLLKQCDELKKKSQEELKIRTEIAGQFL